MVGILKRTLFTILLIAAVHASVDARQSKEGTASISGRVNVAGKPARGVALTLRETTNSERRAIQLFFNGGTLEKTSTDEEGRYRFDGLPVGRYEIVPYAPSLILVEGKSSPITITDGDTIENIDFTLSRGGAITGRVTGPDGRPLILESIQIARTDKKDSSAAFPFAGSSFATDDRGIYRVYGLQPGYYKVGIGKAEPRLELLGLSFSRPDHVQTFHPGVIDETKAAIVEVTAGGETTNIDIKVGGPKKTYTVTGRVIESATGKPVANAITSYMAVNADGSYMPGARALPSTSSSTGEFRLEGLASGRYSAYAVFGLEGSNEYYSEMVNFEVKQEDLTGVEIKAHRGGSISGIAVIDGASDPSVLEKMGRTELFAIVAGEDTTPSFARSKIGEDGGFQLRGLKSGRVRIIIQDFFSQGGLSIIRVERDGVPQPAGIDLAANEHITDLRLVLAQASGVIRGQVSFEGGTLPKEAEVTVVARRKTTEGSPTETGHDSEEADVDASGNFVIEGLIPGEYEVSVTVVLDPGAPARLRPVRSVREQVMVSAGSAAAVTIVVDLRKRSEEKN